MRTPVQVRLTWKHGPGKLPVMVRLDMNSPFKAPVYFVPETSSTMEEARRVVLESDKTPHGSLVCTDHQTSGRGRIQGRLWEDRAGESLLCTCILRKDQLQPLPQAPSLMAGIAVLRAIEDCCPQLSDRCAVKWPNDLIVDGKKICGILCEADRNYIYIGMGVNILQESFPADLATKASSLALLLNNKDVPERFTLLRRLLRELYRLFGSADQGFGSKQPDWQTELEKRLYRKGERVRFIAGMPAEDQERLKTEPPLLIQGILAGIAKDGSLLIQDEASGTIESFISGELDVYA